MVRHFHVLHFQLTTRIVNFHPYLVSGVTERLGALGHIDTRGPFTTSPVTLMSV